MPFPCDLLSAPQGRRRLSHFSFSFSAEQLSFHSSFTVAEGATFIGRVCSFYFVLSFIADPRCLVIRGFPDQQHQNNLAAVVQAARFTVRPRRQSSQLHKVHQIIKGYIRQQLFITTVRKHNATLNAAMLVMTFL